MSLSLIGIWLDRAGMPFSLGLLMSIFMVQVQFGTLGIRGLGAICILGLWPIVCIPDLSRILRPTDIRAYCAFPMTHKRIGSTLWLGIVGIAFIAFVVAGACASAIGFIKPDTGVTPVLFGLICGSIILLGGFIPWFVGAAISRFRNPLRRFVGTQRYEVGVWFISLICAALALLPASALGIAHHHHAATWAIIGTGLGVACAAFAMRGTIVCLVAGSRRSPGFAQTSLSSPAAVRLSAYKKHNPLRDLWNLHGSLFLLTFAVSMGTMLLEYFAHFLGSGLTKGHAGELTLSFIVGTFMLRSSGYPAIHLRSVRHLPVSAWRISFWVCARSLSVVAALFLVLLIHGALTGWQLFTPYLLYLFMLLGVTAWSSGMKYKQDREVFPSLFALLLLSLYFDSDDVKNYIVVYRALAIPIGITAFFIGAQMVRDALMQKSSLYRTRAGN